MSERVTAILSMIHEPVLRNSATRLFRGAGVGVSVVTPLGPLGLDWAYGFDRLSIDQATGRLRPDPKWQLHFRLGQMMF